MEEEIFVNVNVSWEESEREEKEKKKVLKVQDDVWE